MSVAVILTHGVRPSRETLARALERASLFVCADGAADNARAYGFEPGIIIDAKSGVSGAGKTPSERTHFSEIHGSMAADGVFGPRHGVALEQAGGLPITFVPQLVALGGGRLDAS